MRIEGHNELNVAFVGLQKTQDIQDIVDVLLDNRIGGHKGADLHVLTDLLPVAQNGIRTKSVVGVAELEMIAVCADQLVLGKLVETELRDTRHVLLLPSSLHLAERTSGKVAFVVLLHQEFIGCLGDHVLNLGVQD